MLELAVWERKWRGKVTARKKACLHLERKVHETVLVSLIAGQTGKKKGAREKFKGRSGEGG